jgi:hypothetical protein
MITGEAPHPHPRRDAEVTDEVRRAAIARHDIHVP